jgi:uncharacterized protein YfiM (DUF2279 family)
MLDCRLPDPAPLGVRRASKLCFSLLMFIVVVGWAEAAWSQESREVAPDSTVKSHRKFSRDLWLGRDKADHALVSAGLVAAQFYLLHQELDVSGNRSRKIAASSTLLIGIAKEIYDGVSRRGTPSWKDLFADFAGVALAVGIMTQ